MHTAIHTIDVFIIVVYLAGLAGIGIVAGRTLVAEADVMATKADQADLFVIGLPA